MYKDSLYNNPHKNIIGAPSFESDYRELKRLAQYEDDFNVVLGKFKSIAQRVAESKFDKFGKLSDRFTELNKAIKDAHSVYVDTQKMLAIAFADVGDYDNAEHHLFNAAIEVGGEIRLERRISSEDIKLIIDKAISMTPPKYFMQRLVNFSEGGDIEKTVKYIALTLNSAASRGLIQIPKTDPFDIEEITNPEMYEKFFRLQAELRNFHLKAYQKHITTQLYEAMGYAISGFEFIGPLEIAKRKEKVKDLMLDMVKTFVPDRLSMPAYGFLMGYFKDFINPFFSELELCIGDKNHPLMEMLELDKQNKTKPTQIKAKRKEASTTAIVLTSLHQEQFERMSIPIFVHSFYQPVIDMYQK